MYLKGQDELMKYGISENIQKEMKENKFEMTNSYLRNIHIFHIDNLTIDLLSHRLVPNHEVIRDKEHIKQVFKETNSNEYLLPVILRTDPVAKLKRLCPGNICKITRYSGTCGSNVYYRICK
jgi:DNA-directed RNA polymerase subunit H (RpoH/RPB5)